MSTENLSWAGLTPLLRTVVLTIIIRNREPLRIGVGSLEELGSPVDLPVYRQRVYWKEGRTGVEPVIPGSSLKGVLRTASMSLAQGCGLKAHSGVGADNCVYEYYGRRFDDMRKKLSALQLREIIAGLCPICLLYGAPSVSSRITVGDFTPVGPGVRTGIKTGVGIDRRRGASHPGALYTVEYVEPGAEFRGRIRLVNSPNWLLSLLAASLQLLGEGWFKLGGFKTRGMGLVELLWRDAEVRIEDQGIRGSTLPPLDSKVDEEHLFEDCSPGKGSLVCSGERARRAVDMMASLWPQYCAKAKPVLGERSRRARAYGEAGW